MDFDKERSFHTFCDCEKPRHYAGNCKLPYTSIGTIKTAFDHSLKYKVRLTFYEGNNLITIKAGAFNDPTLNP